MTAVLQGVRVLEVAEHTFVPAASALLATGVRRSSRSSTSSAATPCAAWRRPASPLVPTDVHVLLEHSNRGKRSLALDLTLARRSRDPLQARRHRRRVPDEQAPERPRRSSRSASRRSAPTTPPSSTSAGRGRASGAPTPTRAPTTRWRSGRGPASPSAPSDRSTTWSPCRRRPASATRSAAMTIAGGIMGALFHRERTGEATIVDVSLLGVGLWAMGQAMALSLMLGVPVDGAAGGPDRRQPAVAALRDEGRPRPRVHLPAGGQVLAAPLRGRRSARAGHRPPLRRPRRAHGQQRRGRRRR